jgi:glycosyltransferase involved in cell wall biosynthesis
VTLSLDVGGAERHLSGVLPGLSSRGWPVSVYCMYREGAYGSGVRAAGVDVIGPPVVRQAGPQGKARRLYATTLAGARLIAVIRRRRPRIVHFFLPEAYIVGAPAALMMNVPVCVMSRRGLNEYQRNWPGARAIERRLHPRMAGVLANSRRVIADLRDEGCRKEQLGLIYNGVTLDTAFTGAAKAEARAEVRAELGLASETLLGVVVANLVSYKGHADLVAAMARIAPRMGQPWAILCVGRDDGARLRVELQARELGLGDQIVLAGVRHDVARLLAAADLSILPSHQEGFSNAIIEAMASGLPMVVTDAGGNAEAVLHERTGLVVPPRDPERLGEAILRLAQDPVLRQRLGEAGQARAKERFSLKACIDHYEVLYRGLLAGKSPAELPLD